MISADTHVGESKSLRLARYLKEFVGLRSSTVYDVDKYETVLWFGELPQDPDCSSPAWIDGADPDDPWLIVRKQQLPPAPKPPDIIIPWIDQQALKRATPEIPALRATILEADSDAQVDNGEEPPLIARKIADRPEVTVAYEDYREAWLAWSTEYRRRNAIQKVYAELFHLRTQLQKQGELVELVLGLGLLDWPFAGATIRRHIVAARVDLQFDLTAGVIRLNPASDGIRLRIEDDMIDADRRPTRDRRAIIEQKLDAVGDDIWVRGPMFRALRADSVHVEAYPA